VHRQVLAELQVREQVPAEPPRLYSVGLIGGTHGGRPATSSVARINQSMGSSLVRGFAIRVVAIWLAVTSLAEFISTNIVRVGVGLESIEGSRGLMFGIRVEFCYLAT
jgi:hypothetical protein